MTNQFEGKTALITGAGSGIGRAVTQRLAAGGAHVVGVDIDSARLAETSALVAGPLTSIVADISDPAACQDVVKQAVEVQGSLDILGNIAGVLRADHFTDVSVNDYRRMMAVNVDGPFFLTQAAMPYLIESAGAVVMIASTASKIGQAYLTAYSATKGAVAQLTKALAMEYLKTGVRINGIAPGGIDTAMSADFVPPHEMDAELVARYRPIRGMGGPEQIASVFEMLVGEDGLGVHGTIVPVDRGMTVG